LTPYEVEQVQVSPPIIAASAPVRW